MAPDPAPRRARRRAAAVWVAVVRDAVLVTVVRPVSVAVGLAGFLARGGILLLALPVMVLPTPTGLQNALGGPVSSVLFGSLSPALVALVALGVTAAVVSAVLGMLVAAWAEQAGIRLALEAAAEEGLPVRSPDEAGAPGPWRILAIRVLGLLPFAVALLALWPAIYDAGYRELVLPDDLQTPILLRIVRAIPGQMLALAAVLLAGDAAAMAGVRRLVLERRSTRVAWLLGWVDLVRQAPRVLATELVTVLAMLILVAPAILASIVGWDRVRVELLNSPDPVAALVAVGVFVAAWGGGLVLAGWAAAFRNAVWTLDRARISTG
jgi:hypothetical protein